MKKLFLTSVCIVLLSLSVFSQKTTRDYRLFGRITTVDNQILTGFLTWGKQQMYWIDFFRASKIINPYREYFTPDMNVTFISDGRKTHLAPLHVFTCRFGNIESVELTDYNKIRLQVKGGYSMELSRGSYEDIGASITVLQEDASSSVIRWDKISKIEFMPAFFDAPDYHLPITGIIKTNQGIYKGFITWDRDEKNLEDLLDGRSRQGDCHISFRNIRKIVKTRDGCEVSTSDGSILNLWGSNDVNNQNRGILVNMPQTGRVSIPWNRFEAFEALNFNEIAPSGYDDFKAVRRLQAEVHTRKGEIFNGIIAYDLDEAMNLEVLDGKNDNINYEIPFKYVQSIEPKNYRYSFVTLTNGASFSLGDTSDVTNENSGILVFSSDEVPIYIPWKDIKLISFHPEE